MRKSRNLVNVVIILVILGLSPSAQSAEIYRWTDSAGVVHYTDDPPEGIKETTNLNVPDPDRQAETHIRKSAMPEKKAVAPSPVTTETDSLHKIQNFRISQQDGPWCALATIEMIARYYGFGLSQIQVSLESDIARDKGMTLNAILKYFDRLKILMLNVEHHYGGNIESIKKLIDNKIPVIWLHRVVEGTRWGGLHSAVVIGYDDVRRRVVVADPACGCEIDMSYKDFLTRWQKTDNLYVVVTSRL
jgi:hypothetical protein